MHFTFFFHISKQVQQYITGARAFRAADKSSCGRKLFYFSRVWPAVRCDSVMRASSKFILMIVMCTDADRECGACVRVAQRAIPGLGQCVCVCAFFIQCTFFPVRAHGNKSLDLNCAIERVRQVRSAPGQLITLRERCRNAHGPREIAIMNYWSAAAAPRSREIKGSAVQIQKNSGFITPVFLSCRHTFRNTELNFSFKK